MNIKRLQDKSNGGMSFEGFQNISVESVQDGSCDGLLVFLSQPLTDTSTQK